uniref:RING-type domain-containing protein n=1 Tax=viral metagenome TaxID=1070528 RepID=A0A6C0HHY1_9ZZZZ
MDIIISTSKVIPTSTEQVESFSAWATGKYQTYKEYMNPTQKEEISKRIRSNIFTVEMKSMWRDTEPYVGMKTPDIHIGRLLVYRKRLEEKLKFMREKLGKLAFPVEAASIREHQRVESSRRRLERQAPVAVVSMWLPEHQGQGLIPKVFKQLTEEEAKAKMEEACAICMNHHSMVHTCLVNCGHRFGAACFKKWSDKHANCPLCRTWCTEITEYIQ